MAKVKPFKAFLPPKEIAEKIAAPPYDVISSEEAREYAKGNEYSFLHISKPEIDLEEGHPLYDDAVYKKGADNLRDFVKKGYLKKDSKPSFYIYRQIMGSHSQDGFVCLSSVREYEEGKIKIHEYTRQDKEDDRTRHVIEQKANAEPVFLTYRAKKEIDEIVNNEKRKEPLYDIKTDDGIIHQLWAVNENATINRLISLFSEVPALYVADGHHRTAAAVRMGQHFRKVKGGDDPEADYEFFMAVLFPHNQLQIMDYNRVVKDLNGLSEEEFLKKLEEKFIVTKSSSLKPEKQHVFGMYLNKTIYALEAKQGAFNENDPIDSLDVSILQKNVLAPILGIEDPRTDKRIDFIGGIRGMGELIKRVDQGWAVAFALFPTTLDQLLNVADAQKVMPPKSTWFEPKLRSGLFVRILED
ncbi:MAG: DUF1015 family protein [Acidobacteria bacterium]|nr:DUF1015 family protein [Acidobacteriota bacterium]